MRTESGYIEVLVETRLQTMATWMSTDRFASQVKDDNPLDKKAPNPAEYPESSSQSRSYWIREHPISWDDSESSHLPKEVDIAIIGSGITGASVAYHLSVSRPDLSVAVLEARGVCSGATGRNGGHIGRPSPYHIRKLAETFGDEEAVRLREFPLRNKKRVLECIKSLGIAEYVDLRVDGTIVVFKSDEERVKYLKDDEWGRERNMEIEGVVLNPEETTKVG